MPLKRWEQKLGSSTLLGEIGAALAEGDVNVLIAGWSNFGRVAADTIRPLGDDKPWFIIVSGCACVDEMDKAGIERDAFLETPFTIDEIGKTICGLTGRSLPDE